MAESDKRRCVVEVVYRVLTGSHSFHSPRFSYKRFVDDLRSKVMMRKVRYRGKYRKLKDQDMCEEMGGD